MEYPYTQGDRLGDRNTYFYTPYGGQAFLDAWWRDREAYLSSLPKSVPPASLEMEAAPETQPVETASLLYYLYAALSEGRGDKPDVKRWLEKLLKKFEVTKHIHGTYNPIFRAIDRSDYLNHSLYVRLAVVLEGAFRATRDIRFLNTLLKCLDTLCSIKAELIEQDQARLAWLINQERRHVDSLSESLKERR